jgi:hypothetical protein
MVANGVGVRVVAGVAVGTMVTDGTAGAVGTSVTTGVGVGIQYEYDGTGTTGTL